MPGSPYTWTQLPVGKIWHAGLHYPAWRAPHSKGMEINAATTKFPDPWGASWTGWHGLTGCFWHAGCGVEQPWFMILTFKHISMLFQLCPVGAASILCRLDLSVLLYGIWILFTHTRNYYDKQSTVMLLRSPHSILGLTLFCKRVKDNKSILCHLQFSWNRFDCAHALQNACHMKRMGSFRHH